MSATFFPTPQDFRNWLEKNHQNEKELLVGFYKVATKKPSMTWSESVDQALCFGWIDGVRKSIDEESYSIRFTPRKPTSIWSAINIKKIEDLTKAGLMTPQGLKAFELRKPERSAIYSHEKELASLYPDYEKQFKANKKAWEFFNNQAPSYQKVMLHWITSAKQEKTRLSRLEKAIRESELGKRVLL
ncbi:YdeI/OmpD-associated family protein [Chryseobacterium sp. Y16C]|uniref:YdeI/OmpD-associated family protein n=1 Tax=Chryseobacterium sp. Y16C TaxID=2920939 RepID=UPI001F0B54C2|nr:YdeI/OmpD-associated family protein [Chryseobacterium sp. Y16C]UMQ41402.1 YdeI/OmpD-associated family protein [Chryseobacterium sp. Y16C]